MRKLLILLLFPLLMGCSNDDHEDEIVNEGLVGSWITDGSGLPQHEKGYNIETFMNDGRYYSHYWSDIQEKWSFGYKSQSYTIKDDIVTLDDLVPTIGATLRYEIKEVGKSKTLTLYLYYTTDNKERLWGVYQKMSNKDVKDTGITFD